MIAVYKKKSIPKNLELIKINDVFFNMYTSVRLDKKAEEIINIIDCSRMIDQYTISSRFDGTRLNVDKLSTGCKTALNILYNPDKIFDVSECGENALEVIYSLDSGRIYCDFPMIAFTMQEVEAIDSSGSHVIKDYESLREWWKDEN